MATTEVLINGVQPTATTVQTLYTAPASSAGTRVIAFTATNSTVTTATYDLHVVPSGGSADDTNRVVSARSLIQNATNTPPEVQNHLIPAGGTLEIKVSVATTIAFRATGIEF